MAVTSLSISLGSAKPQNVLFVLSKEVGLNDWT